MNQRKQTIRKQQTSKLDQIEEEEKSEESAVFRMNSIKSKGTMEESKTSSKNLTITSEFRRKVS